MNRGAAVYQHPEKSLNEQEERLLNEAISRRAGAPGELIPLMQEAQDICGNWLPANVLARIADGCDVHLSHVYGLMTFYTMFSPQPRGKYVIRVCESPACHILGVETLFTAIEDLLGIKENETTPDGLFTLEKSSCLGVCEVAPALQINEVVHGNLTKESLAKIFDDYRNGKAVDYHTLPCTGGQFRKEDAKGGQPQLLRGIGELDPESIDDYIKDGGYSGLKKSLKLKPAGVVDEVKKSGLRGRGGAGFPTGLKWSFTLPLENHPKYVVCNADEGEGTFKDRYIMEGVPHRLIEGITIAGYAVQARAGYIYVRGEYALSKYRLEKAIQQAMEHNLLGKNIQGSGFDFDIHVHAGAGAYVCGEETALIESIEGMRGNPRVKPPFPGVVGLYKKPTVVNNVETLTNVPLIMANGAEWYSKIGVDDSLGLKLYQICGHVNTPRVVEAPLGLSLRELIDVYGGGMKDGSTFKMCQTGGASFGFFTANELDTPMTYADMQKKGGALGSGTMLIMNDKTCVVDVIRNILYFYQHESCGFCTPCRRGTRVLYDTASRIARGEGKESDLAMMIDLANTMTATANCALAMSPIFFVKTTIERFRDEYMAHIVDGKCPLGVCG